MADLVFSCIDCGEDFDLTEGEQIFFKQKGLSTPRRCKPCRAKRKQDREREQATQDNPEH